MASVSRLRFGLQRAWLSEIPLPDRRIVPYMDVALIDQEKLGQAGPHHYLEAEAFFNMLQPLWVRVDVGCRLRLA